MTPHERPACRDCVHSGLQTASADNALTIHVCLRVESHPVARLERVDGPIVATVSGQCGVNGRYFVPGHR